MFCMKNGRFFSKNINSIKLTDNETLAIKTLVLNTALQAYLGPCQTSVVELFLRQ